MKKEIIETYVVREDAVTGQARAIPVRRSRKRRRQRRRRKLITMALLCILMTAVTITGVTLKIKKEARRDQQLAFQEAENERMSVELELVENRVTALETELAQVTAPKPVSDAMVEEKLTLLGAMPTFNYNYSGTCIASGGGQSRGYGFWGGYDQMEIAYNGVIQIAYNASDIVYVVDEDRKKIEMILPKPEILDNCLSIDGYRGRYGNSMQSTQMTYISEQIEEKELQKAVSLGLYEEVDLQIKNAIRNCLSGFDNYEVDFIIYPGNNRGRTVSA